MPNFVKGVVYDDVEIVPGSLRIEQKYLTSMTNIEPKIFFLQINKSK